MDRPAEAIGWYRKARTVAPNDIGVLDNLGTALRKSDQLAEAVASHEEAIRLAPNSARSHNHLGVALMEMNRADEAIASYRRSLALEPRSHRTHNNLALALKHAGRREESLAGFRQALSLAPGDIVSLNNLGVALMEHRQFGAALAHFDEAIRLDPRDAESHFHRALLWLVTGDFVRGWPEYEWRPQRPAEVPSIVPTWDGSYRLRRPQDGAPPLGTGLRATSIHFVRYASLVKARGGHVVLETRPELAPLLATCPGVDRDHRGGRQTRSTTHRAYANLASLPGIAGTNLTNIPRRRSRICMSTPNSSNAGGSGSGPPLSGLRVGIAWQEVEIHPGTATGRSIRFVSPTMASSPRRSNSSACRRGDATADDFRFLDRTAELESFLDTAALVKNLDLVITVDTSVAHLARQLRMPVWGVSRCRSFPDWRHWMFEDREDSPWYPTMWLVRQSALDQWDDVFARIVRELETHVAGRVN